MLEKGHRLEEIKEYTFLQFMVFDRAAQRQEASRRTLYISDMTTIIAGVFAKDGNKDLREHLQSLIDFSSEDQENGKPVQQSRR